MGFYSWAAADRRPGLTALLHKPYVAKDKALALDHLSAFDWSTVRTAE
jgi:hypothetical protein